jgi:pseudouridine-5'-phosphate glycosidase
VKYLEEYLEISEEVKDALSMNRPIVALESTIISHGMPYPKNVETALNVEQVVRDNGAVPATIAIIGGALKVGLSGDEIEYISKKGPGVAKASRRDIPVLVARGEDGATTVAATMIIADLAGIPVFCTGGIGGVHRGAETTMDISADLEELANTQVLVVCAGPKAILDIKLTLEYLETKGVPVLGYRTEELPAFYSRKSGFKVDCKVDTAKEAAEIFVHKKNLRLKGGMIVANPIPEEWSFDEDYINGKIAEALAEAEQKDIRGKETTPFLLDKVKEITGGKSLIANIALVMSNAEVSSKIAAEIAKLKSI